MMVMMVCFMQECLIFYSQYLCLEQMMPSPEKLKGKIILKLRKLPGGMDEFTPLAPNMDEREYTSLLKDHDVMKIFVSIV